MLPRHYGEAYRNAIKASNHEQMSRYDRPVENRLLAGFGLPKALRGATFSGAESERARTRFSWSRTWLDEPKSRNGAHSGYLP
jgi:hypothetical protein